MNPPLDNVVASKELRSGGVKYIQVSKRQGRAYFSVIKI